MGFIHLGLFCRRISSTESALYLVCIHEDCLGKNTHQRSVIVISGKVRFGVILNVSLRVSLVAQW